METNRETGWFLRVVQFPLVYLALLYVVLTYLHLSGFFFRQSFTDGPITGLAAAAMEVAMMLTAYATLGFFIERRNVGDLALPRMAPEVGVGLLLGFGLYSLCILILMMLGVYRIDGINAWQTLLPGLAGPLATGVYEELLYRGGVFRIAENWFGSWIALIVSSLVFGLAHLANDSATMQGILSISIWAGVLLAATYMLTRRLWLGIGLHAAWNYTQGSVYSGIVSGSDAPMPGLIKASLQGPVWLTGGEFGVEASLVALLVCTTVGVAMLATAGRRGNIVRPFWKRNAPGATPALG